MHLIIIETLMRRIFKGVSSKPQSIQTQELNER